MTKIGSVAALVAALAAGGCCSVSMQETLDGFTGTERITGVVSVLSDADYDVQVDCSGWADAERRVPIAADSMFAIFSMSKTFCGAAMMCAIDDGKISLDDPVAKYLPEFADVKMKDGSKPKRLITVRDVMCHSSGLRAGYPIVDRDIPLREVARKFAASPLEAQPGETFAYNNSGICTGAACIEIAVGEPYERYLQRRILDPLGMKDTTFWPNEEQQKRLPKAYTSTAFPIAPGNDRCTPQLVFPKKGRVYPCASAGLFSTPMDMIRFSQMLAHHGQWKDKTIISRKTFDGIWTVKQTAANLQEPYTVGSWVWGDWFGHEGALRTDQRANLKTGHSRVFFIQTENRGGPAFFQLKAVWQHTCDKLQGVPTTIFGT